MTVSKLTGLEVLMAWDAQVTDVGIARLREELPKLKTVR